MAGLVDRVVELRAARNIATEQVIKAPQLTPNLTPKPIIETQPTLVPIPPNPEEQAIAAEKQRILEHFGVREKLEEIKDKYWQCGKIFPLSGGYQLQMLSSESYIRLTGKSVLEGSYGYYSSVGPLSSGNGNFYYREIYTPSTPRWVQKQEIAYSPVRNIVKIQALELPRKDLDQQSEDAINNLGLAVAIGLNPASYNAGLENQFLPPIETKKTERYYDTRSNSELYLTFDEWLELESKRSSRDPRHNSLVQLGKYPYYPTPSRTNVVENLDIEQLIIAIQSLETEKLCRPNIPKGKLSPGRIPNNPWTLIVKQNGVSKLDEFLAKYVVGVGFDNDPLVNTVLPWERK